MKLKAYAGKIGACALAAGLIALGILMANGRYTLLLGGCLAQDATAKTVEEYRPANAKTEPSDTARFMRPSRKTPLNENASWPGMVQQNPTLAYPSAQAAITAFYTMLREASNMLNYSGICGTVGDAQNPYPDAYRMLSARLQSAVSLKQFERSFSGIGHISLITLFPLQTSNEYLVELEVITGKEDGGNAENISYFAYYYGKVCAVQEDGAWRLDEITYLPEAFLCAPYHGWAYDARYFTEIVLMENLGAITGIDDTAQTGSLIQIFATGGGGKYRLDFIRLANGCDILVGEYVLKEGKWTPTELLREPWAGYLFS